MRLLLNLEASLGGGAPAEPVLNVTAAAPVTEPAKPAAPAPNPLAADLAAARSRLAELEKADAERERLKVEAEEKKLAEKGEYEKLIKQRDERLAAEIKKAADSDARARTYALSSQLAVAFSGHDLYEGSAEDLSKLWRDDFEAVPEGDGFVVRSKDGRPVKDVITERLSLPRYSNHVKATSRSGSGGGSGNTPAPTQTPDPSKAPASYQEWAKQVLQVDQSNSNSFGGLFGHR